MVMLRERHKWKPHKADSIDVPYRGGQTRSSVEAFVMRVEQRSLAIQLQLKCQPFNGRSL